MMKYEMMQWGMMTQILRRYLSKTLLAFLLISLLIMPEAIGLNNLESPDSGVARIVGWIEYTTMTGVNSVLKAKLDTGANTASINAEILEEPKRGSKSDGIVKFYFVDSDGNKTLFERPLTRWVAIKGKNRRPVVDMDFCIAGVWVNGEVTLADRHRFNYPVLVGRNLLQQGRFVVDSAQSFIAGSSCRPEKSS